MRGSASRALLLALFTTLSLLVATGSPAGASGCATVAHVYVNGGHVKYEYEPIDGATDTVSILSFGSIKLGGNGLRRYEDPFWDVYRESDGAYVGTLIGNRTGGNCVSNEKSFTINLYPGDYIFRATYEPGNTGGVVRGQAHFRLAVF